MMRPQLEEMWQHVVILCIFHMLLAPSSACAHHCQHDYISCWKSESLFTRLATFPLNSCVGSGALDICCILIRDIIFKPQLRQTLLKYYPKNTTFPKETAESLWVCVCVCVLFSAFCWKSRKLLPTPAKMVMPLSDFQFWWDLSPPNKQVKKGSSNEVATWWLFLFRMALLRCCAPFQGSERKRLAGRGGINPAFPSGHEHSHQTQGQVIAATIPMAKDLEKELLWKKRNLSMAESEIEVLCPPTATAQNVHTKPQLIFHEGHGNAPSDVITEIW